MVKKSRVSNWMSETIGWRASRHEEVGGDEAPGEPCPPGLPGLIEGYALKILDMTIPFAFALEEIAQAVSERGHRRGPDYLDTAHGPTTGNFAARQRPFSTPLLATRYEVPSEERVHASRRDIVSFLIHLSAAV